MSITRLKQKNKTKPSAKRPSASEDAGLCGWASISRGMFLFEGKLIKNNDEVVNKKQDTKDTTSNTK